MVILSRRKISLARKALAASFLGQYGDVRALPLVHELFEACEVVESPLANLHIHDFVEAIEDLGGELTAGEQAKLEAATAGAERFRAQLDALAERAWHLETPYVASKVPGRNEPCWCGSGRKYKKCHLNDDREN